MCNLKMQDEGECNVMFSFDALGTAGQHKVEDGVELRSWTHSCVEMFSVL
jgi:hypothetical protein